MTLLEVACFNPESAIIALTHGADRVELCRDYSAGGLTPSAADIDVVLAHLAAHPREARSTSAAASTDPRSSITSPPASFSALRPRASASAAPSPRPAAPRLMVMIRPHAASFTYDAPTLAAMAARIRDVRAQAAAAGVAGDVGFVFGALDEAGWISGANAALVTAAGDAPCTFHRAFDLVLGSWEDSDGSRQRVQAGLALRELSALGFGGVLTAGHDGTSRLRLGGALGGIGVLKEVQRMVGEVCPRHVVVIAGGGVRANNVADVVRGMGGAEWVHSAALGSGGDEQVSGLEVRRLKEVLEGLD